METLFWDVLGARLGLPPTATPDDLKRAPDGLGVPRNKIYMKSRMRYGFHIRWFSMAVFFLSKHVGISGISNVFHICHIVNSPDLSTSSFAA